MRALRNNYHIKTQGRKAHEVAADAAYDAADAARTAATAAHTAVHATYYNAALRAACLAALDGSAATKIKINNLLIELFS